MNKYYLHLPNDVKLANEGRTHYRADADIKQLIHNAYRRVQLNHPKFGLLVRFEREESEEALGPVSLALITNMPGIVVGTRGRTIENLRNAIHEIAPELDVKIYEGDVIC